MDSNTCILIFALIVMLNVTTNIFATWMYPNNPPEGNLHSNSLYINFINSHCHNNFKNIYEYVPYIF